MYQFTIIVAGPDGRILYCNSPTATLPGEGCISLPRPPEPDCTFEVPQRYIRNHLICLRYLIVNGSVVVHEPDFVSAIRPDIIVATGPIEIAEPRRLPLQDVIKAVESNNLDAVLARYATVVFDTTGPFRIHFFAKPETWPVDVAIAPHLSIFNGPTLVATCDVWNRSPIRNAPDVSEFCDLQVVDRERLARGIMAQNLTVQVVGDANVALSDPQVRRYWKGSVSASVEFIDFTYRYGLDP